MDIVDSFVAAAKRRDQTVVLPEGNDERILRAARRMQDQAIARPILLGDPEQLSQIATQAGASLDGITLIDPAANDRLEAYAESYASCHPNTNPKVAQRLVGKPLFYAAMMVRSGDAAAMVAGVANPTARVIEAGLKGVGLADGVLRASSFFVMVLPEFQGERDKAFIYADCAVNIDPTPEQLAGIAIASAASAAKLLRETPRVAMLSFSTKGSAHHARVDKVTRALEIARQHAPDLAIDGEFQVDSALIKSVAARKVQGVSAVAGQANVLIFPDLDAGNIAYKLTQYMANAQAIGPILQGFAQPVSDLSRGANVEDIVAATAIALVQA